MNAITLLIVWVGAHRIDEGIMQVGTMMAHAIYYANNYGILNDINGFSYFAKSYGFSSTCI